jgi:hypothetical protein
MELDEFRRHAHALVDRTADYMDRVEGYPVRERRHVRAAWRTIQAIARTLHP